jgi:hypothetical protein
MTEQLLVEPTLDFPLPQDDFDDAKWSHTKPESPIRQAWTALDSNQGVPVNLTYKLTKKQQTIKFESVPAGFLNNSHAPYRQDSADTENDKDQIQ